MVLLGERSVKASADTRAGSKTGRLRPAAGSSAVQCRQYGVALEDLCVLGSAEVQAPPHGY